MIPGGINLRLFSRGPSAPQATPGANMHLTATAPGSTQMRSWYGLVPQNPVSIVSSRQNPSWPIMRRALLAAAPAAAGIGVSAVYAINSVINGDFSFSGNVGVGAAVCMCINLLSLFPLAYAGDEFRDWLSINRGQNKQLGQLNMSQAHYNFVREIQKNIKIGAFREAAAQMRGLAELEMTNGHADVSMTILKSALYYFKLSQVPDEDVELRDTMATFARAALRLGAHDDFTTALQYLRNMNGSGDPGVVAESPFLIAAPLIFQSETAEHPADGSRDHDLVDLATLQAALQNVRGGDIVADIATAMIIDGPPGLSFESASDSDADDINRLRRIAELATSSPGLRELEMPEVDRKLGTIRDRIRASQEKTNELAGDKTYHDDRDSWTVIGPFPNQLRGIDQRLVTAGLHLRADYAYGAKLTLNEALSNIARVREIFVNENYGRHLGVQVEGNILRDKTGYVTALAYYEAKVHLEAGKLALILLRFDDAASHFESAIASIGEERFPGILNDARVLRGVVGRRLGEQVENLDEIKRSELSLAENWLELAQFHLDDVHPEGALELAFRALDVYRSWGDETREAEARILLNDALREMGRSDVVLADEIDRLPIQQGDGEDASSSEVYIAEEQLVVR